MVRCSSSMLLYALKCSYDQKALGPSGRGGGGGCVGVGGAMFFNVALRPDTPYRLLRDRSPGRPLFLFHTAPELRVGRYPAVPFCATSTCRARTYFS